MSKTSRRKSQAILELRDVARARPKSPRAQFELGVHLIDNKAEEAVILLRKAINLRSDLGEIHNGYGIALFRTGAHKQAVSEFGEAKKLLECMKDEKSEVSLNLGIALEACRRYKAASLEYGAACAGLRRDPNKIKVLISALQRLGFVLEMQGFYEKAISIYTEASKTFHEHSMKNKEVQDLLANDEEAARALLRKHFEAVIDPRVRLKLQGELTVEQIEKDTVYTRPKALKARRAAHRLSLHKTLIILHWPPSQRDSKDSMKASDALTEHLTQETKPSWKPAGEYSVVKSSKQQQPSKQRPRPAYSSHAPSVPSLAPRWRAAKKRQPIPVGYGELLRDGEYIPPRPAYFDPIGDVPLYKPIMISPSSSPAVAHASQRLSAPELSRRAALRRALATVGNNNDDLGSLFSPDEGPRLCWELTPRAQLRHRIPPTQDLLPEDEEHQLLADRRPWKI